MRLAFSGLNNRLQLSSGVSGAAALIRSDVHTQPHRAPQVDSAVPVARVGRFDPPHQHRIEGFPVRHTVSVDLGQCAGVDQPRERRFIAWQHDVVVGMTGQQFRLERLEAVEDIVTNLDPGLGGELLQRGGVDVVGPVEDDVHDVVPRPARGGQGCRPRGESPTAAVARAPLTRRAGGPARCRARRDHPGSGLQQAAAGGVADARRGAGDRGGSGHGCLPIPGCYRASAGAKTAPVRGSHGAHGGRISPEEAVTRRACGPHIGCDQVGVTRRRIGGIGALFLVRDRPALVSRATISPSTCRPMARDLACVPR